VVQVRADAYMNRQYLDPVFLRRYPEEMREVFGDAWPDFPAADLEHIRQPSDFVGVNYYTRKVTKNDPLVLPVRASGARQKHHIPRPTGRSIPKGSPTRSSASNASTATSPST
jgi:beta-glucosidase